MTPAEKKKRPVPILGKLAVKHKFITKDQLKHALTIQDDEKKAGRSPSLAEILAKTGMLSPERMAQLHSVVSEFKTTPEIPESEPLKGTDKTDKYLAVSVSEDRLTAELTVPEGYSQPVTFDDVSTLIKAKGICFGIVKDYVISNYIQDTGNFGSPLIIARGTPPYDGKPASVAYSFDTLHFRNESLTIELNTLQKPSSPPSCDDGDLLAEKTHRIPSEPGTDIFSHQTDVPEVEDITIKCGCGAEIFEDQLKIFSTVKGTPMLSVEGKVCVFKDVAISGDYGVPSGPVDEDSNVTASATITGEYPLKGGHIRAQEARNATIDCIGDIRISVGITGSTIRTQGDIYAKYIHGSSIETYGSVIVENEILDSTIISSGIVISRTSKIIASSIAAKRGVRASGIGTETSEPCTITVGRDLHVEHKTERIQKIMDANIAVIRQLESQTEELTDERKQINQKIIPLMEFHKDAEKAIKVTEEKINQLKKKSSQRQLIPATKNLNELKTKDSNALKSIRAFSERLKEVDSITGEIPSEIKRLKELNNELGSDKTAILAWANTIDEIAVLHVSGTIASGTMLSGTQASFEFIDPQSGIFVQEKIQENEDATFVIKKKQT